MISSTRSKYKPDNLFVTVGTSKIYPSQKCKSLRAIFDKHFNFRSQVSQVCKSTYFSLKKIGSVRNQILDEPIAQLIHSLISSRLDYCNSLLYGMPEYEISRLQKIQNSAARILTRTPRHNHITEILKRLHWLPV